MSPVRNGAMQRYEASNYGMFKTCHYFYTAVVNVRFYF